MPKHGNLTKIEVTFRKGCSEEGLKKGSKVISIIFEVFVCPDLQTPLEHGSCSLEPSVSSRREGRSQDRFNDLRSNLQ